MSRRRWAVALALAVVVLATTAVAVAQVTGPSFDQVQATVTYTDGTVRFRECEGPDGTAADAVVVVRGRATGDPLLSGNVTVRLSINLVETDTGEGLDRGTMRIRDPQTNRLKVSARLIQSGIEEIGQGLLVGTVRGGGALYANVRTTFFENGAIITQIGGEVPDGRLPALVKRGGRCPGPFGPAETSQIPPPAAGSTAARQTRGERTGWLRLASR
jgi:hypothetical protein